MDKDRSLACLGRMGLGPWLPSAALATMTAVSHVDLEAFRVRGTGLWANRARAARPGSVVP